MALSVVLLIKIITLIAVSLRLLTRLLLSLIVLFFSCGASILVVVVLSSLMGPTV